MEKLVLKDFSGGLYTIEDPESIPDNAAVVMDAVAKPVGPMLRSRPSSGDGTSYPGYLYNIDANGKLWFNGNLLSKVSTNLLYRNAVNVYTGAGSYDFMAFIAQPILGASTLDYAYILGFDVPIKISIGGTVTNWGFDPPSSTLTATTTAAVGSLNPGSVYKYHVTFLNSSTGERSNPHEYIAFATAGANGAIQLTNIPTSSDAQVNYVEIWRTYADGSAFFKLHQVVEGTTSYLDTLADSTLDGAELIEYDNVELPPALKVCYGPWNNSAFLVSAYYPGRIYYTKPGRFEFVQGYIDFCTEDDSIKRIISYGGNLYAIATSHVYQIYGDNPYYFRELTGIQGTNAPFSVAETPYGFVWKCRDGLRMFSGGAQSDLIAKEQLKATYEKFRTDSDGATFFSRKSSAFQCCFARNELIIRSVTSGAYSFAIDLQTNHVRNLNVEPYFPAYDEENDIIAYTHVNGKVLALEDFRLFGLTFSDDGDDIDFKWRSKRFRFPSMVRIHRIKVKHHGRNGETITFQAFPYDDLLNFEISQSLSTVGSAGLWSQDVIDCEDLVCESLQFQIYADLASEFILRRIEVDYTPLTLDIITPKGVAHLIGYNDYETSETSNCRIKFLFDGENLDFLGQLYNIEALVYDAENVNTYGFELYYTSINGVTFYYPAYDTGGTREQEFKYLRRFWPLSQIELRYTANSALKIHRLELHLSPIELKISDGRQMVSISGRFDSTTVDQLVFDNISEYINFTEQAYYVEYLDVQANTNSIDMTPTFYLMDDTAYSFSVINNAAKRKERILINQVFNLKRFDLWGPGLIAGGFFYVSSPYLKIKPVTLDIYQGNQVFKIPGSWDDDEADFIFNRSPDLDAGFSLPCIFEKFVFFADGGAAVDITIDFQENISDFTDTFNPPSNVSVTEVPINRIGTFEYLMLTASNFRATVKAMRKFSLITRPLTLEVFYGNERFEIPAHHITSDYTIEFRPINSLELPFQDICIFEKIIYYGTLDTYDLDFYLYFQGEVSNFTDSFSVTSTLETQEININRLGRFDSLVFTDATDLALTANFKKLTLICRPLVLDIQCAGQNFKLPATYTSDDNYIDFYLKDENSQPFQVPCIFEYLIFTGNPNSAARTFYLEFYEGVTWHTDTLYAIMEDSQVHEINRLGKFKRFRFYTSGVYDTQFEIDRLKLICRPVVLELFYGDQRYEIPAESLSGEGGDLFFNLTNQIQEPFQDTCFFENLILYANTNSSVITATIEFQGELSDFSDIFVGTATLITQTIDVKRMGRFRNLTLSATGLKSIVDLRKITLICRPLVLDIIHNNQKFQLPGTIVSDNRSLEFYLKDGLFPEFKSLCIQEKILITADMNSVAENLVMLFHDNVTAFTANVIANSVEETQEIPVKRLGRFKSLYFSGGLDSTIDIAQVTLISRSIPLEVQFAGQTYNIEGEFLTSTGEIVFRNFNNYPELAQNICFFERLILYANTNSTAISFDLNFQGTISAYSDTFTTTVTLTTQTKEIQRMGKFHSLALSGTGLKGAVDLRKITLIARPLVLEIQEGQQNTKIPGFFTDDSTYLEFYKPGEVVEGFQSISVFEKLLITANTVGQSPTFRMYFHDNIYGFFDILDPTTSSVSQEIEIDRMGRFKTFQFDSSLNSTLDISQIVLVSRPVILKLFIDDQMKIIPGYFSNASQEIVFELFAHEQESLQTTYIFKNFFYDWDTDGAELTCTLYRFGGTSQVLGIFTDATRTEGEINISKKGRFKKLVISGDFTSAVSYIRLYNLELTMRAARHHKDK